MVYKSNTVASLFTVELPVEESSTTTMFPLTTTTPIPLTTLPMNRVHHTTAAKTPPLTTEDTPTTERLTVSTMTATNPLITVSSNETTTSTTEPIPTTTIQGNYDESLMIELPVQLKGTTTAK